MTRKQDLQQFFIIANSSQDKRDFNLDEFTDRYLRDNPKISIDRIIKCPKCKGHGKVNVPPYIAGNHNNFGIENSSTSMLQICDLCNGLKIISEITVCVID